MKRFSLLILVMFMVCAPLFAQKGEKAVSVNLGYGAGDFHKAFKVGAEFKYNVTDAVRIAPGFDYFFKSHGVGLWSANVNGHYLFDIKAADGLKVYPLFGFTLLGTAGSGEDIKSEDYRPSNLPDGYEDMFDDLFDSAIDQAKAAEGNQTKFGCNLGAGIQYPVARNIDLGFELKYQFVSDFGQVVFGFNVAYKF